MNEMADHRVLEAVDGVICGSPSEAELEELAARLADQSQARTVLDLLSARCRELQRQVVDLKALVEEARRRGAGDTAIQVATVVGVEEEEGTPGQIWVSVVPSGSSQRRRVRVAVVGAERPRLGERALLSSDGQEYLGVAPCDEVLPGRVGEYVARVGNRRLLVESEGRSELVVAAEGLNGAGLRPGDRILYEPMAEVAFERLSRGGHAGVLEVVENPVERLGDLVGLPVEIEDVVWQMTQEAARPGLLSGKGVERLWGVMLSGPPRTGKTTTDQEMAAAVTEAPPGSQARPRGRVIRKLARRPDRERWHAGWTSMFPPGGGGEAILFSDPFSEAARVGARLPQAVEPIPSYFL
ncbi:MAG: hypothetical protein HY720_24710 [Planctomycetes bacterium]|nr:hypothetical protein [Planctomycetota bacterium]